MFLTGRAWPRTVMGKDNKSTLRLAVIWTPKRMLCGCYEYRLRPILLAVSPFRPFLTSMKRPPRCCGLNAMRAPSVVAVPIVGRYESGEQEAEVLGKVRTLLDNVMAAQ
jgi:hypothetical protein